MTELPDVPDDLDEPLKLDSGQVITREVLEGLREVDRDYARALDEGTEPQPPIAGVRYVAAGIYPPNGEQRPWLLALAIGHLDDDRQFALDLLMRDLTDQAATLSVLRPYGLSTVSRFGELDSIGCPFAQAAATACAELLKPPPPPPYECRSWQHMLVMQRNVELGDAVRRQFTDANGWPPSVADAWEISRDYYYADDLEKADRWLRVAEWRLLKEARAFKADPQAWWKRKQEVLSCDE